MKFKFRILDMVFYGFLLYASAGGDFSTHPFVVLGVGSLCF